MFRITQDPSSRSGKLYWTEITGNGSIVLVMCVVGVWRHNLNLLCVCVCVCMYAAPSGEVPLHPAQLTGSEYATKNQQRT
jgi:hypothetical protein